ncbi:MAG: hypothetical protein ACLGRW_06215 [Acidobacteriota bacterium]
MKSVRGLALVSALLLPFFLSGCFLVFTRRKLPVPKTPTVVQTVTPDELVERLNQRWDGLQTLSAKVQIAATVLKSSEGLAKDYTTFRAMILIRKPEDLGVFGQMPVVHTWMFYLVSNGQNFTAYIPSKSKAYRGSDSSTKNIPPEEGPVSSAKSVVDQLLSLRPGMFFNAMVVRGLSPEDYYSVTADTETMEDPSKKHLYSMPEYILSITHHVPGSRRDIPVRVITFNRDDLLPHQQDIYDENGNVQTQVTYTDYQDFGSVKFPAIITMKRPMEGLQLVLSVESVKENIKLSDDQFEVKLPPDTRIQNLE